MNLERKYVHLISGRLQNYRFNGNVHQLRCPYCQLSDRDSKGRSITDAKAKGYFYEKNGTLNFKCHKCGTGKQFHNFLKDHFSSEFIAYVKERERVGTTGKGHNCPTLANALESIGALKFEKPVFNEQETRQDANSPMQEVPPPIQKEVCGNPPKIQILPPMKSPQQQAGCQGRINLLIKQKHERERKRRGDFW